MFAYYGSAVLRGTIEIHKYKIVIACMAVAWDAATTREKTEHQVGNYR
jgi:hypothetical protein